MEESNTIESNHSESDKYSKLLKIPVELTIQVGQAKVTVKDLMSLKEGDVVPLNRMVSESFDIHANGTKIAEGEVVESDDNFFVKISKLMDGNENE